MKFPSFVLGFRSRSVETRSNPSIGDRTLYRFQAHTFRYCLQPVK